MAKKDANQEKLPAQTIQPEGIPSAEEVGAPTVEPALAAGRFRRLPVMVNAERLTLPAKVETAKGVLWAKRGEWVVFGPDGLGFICRDEYFRKNYEPVAQEGEPEAAAAPAATEAKYPRKPPLSIGVK